MLNSRPSKPYATLKLLLQTLDEEMANPECEKINIVCTNLNLSAIYIELRRH